MNWATTFAIDFASFELTMQESLFFVALFRAWQTHQLSLVVVLDFFQQVFVETLRPNLLVAALTCVEVHVMGRAPLLPAFAAHHVGSSLFFDPLASVLVTLSWGAFSCTRHRESGSGTPGRPLLHGFFHYALYHTDYIC